jgi:hypothetical protein
VGALKPPDAVGTGVASLSEIQQQEYVGDELLCTRVKDGPAGGRRDPQVLFPPWPLLRGAGPGLGNDRSFVDPEVFFGLRAFESPLSEPAGFRDERVIRLGIWRTKPKSDKATVVKVLIMICPLVDAVTKRR